MELFTEVIKTQNSKYKDEKYCTNVRYPPELYAKELLRFTRNSIYFSRHSATYNNYELKGKRINTRHLEYARMDVYNILYKTVLNLYFSENFCDKMKFQKADSTFILNKFGIESLGRNIEYKSKQGIKISFIVESTNVPIAISFARGSDADSSIFHDTYNKFLIDPKTSKYKNNKRFKQHMLIDAGYDSDDIKNKLIDDGYTVYVGKNLRKAKPQSFNIKPISDKNRKVYNKRIGVENTNSWIKQYGILTCMYEKTIESYEGLLLLVLSYIVYNKYIKIVNKKKLDESERERKQLIHNIEIEQKRYARKLKRKNDEEQRTVEKELRKQQKQINQANLINNNIEKEKSTIYSVRIGEKIRYISIIKSKLK
ncbi:MAG: transposase [Bacteroidetes bacterium]|nr:transposase [Bacteroidota bacterium]